jgi:hypothetical protein
MPRKNSPSSNSNPTTLLELDNDTSKRFFSHMFKLSLQQMRLQRAVISFLTTEMKPEDGVACDFPSILVATVVEEKNSLIKMLLKQQEYLKGIAAPDVILEMKEKQITAVTDSMAELEGTEAKQYVAELLEKLKHTILREYYEMVLGFVGDDTPWPIHTLGDEHDELIDEMLRI